MPVHIRRRHRPSPSIRRKRLPTRALTTVAVASLVAALSISVGADEDARNGPRPVWISPQRYRIVVDVAPVRQGRSQSPVTVEIDPTKRLHESGIPARFDPDTIEVVAHDSRGEAAVHDVSAKGHERHLLPCRYEPSYGIDRGRLHFVLPDETYRTVVVYFETESEAEDRPKDERRSNFGGRRYSGPVGDGDFLRQARGRREIGATHFDCLVDLDADGDLDLVRGGVEPFLTVLENTGDRRMVSRGRLTSGGSTLALPHNEHNGRSWVVPHFHDIDHDGDLDLLPSFMDGPHAGRILWLENTTAASRPPTYQQRGPLRTSSGIPVAGGEQAGGWFPSVVFIDRPSEDGSHSIDLLVGSNNRAYLYRCAGRDPDGTWRWSDAVALTSDGETIDLFNPCFDVADIDADGDWDLLAAPQSGQILLYENVGPSGSRPDVGDRLPPVPRFSKGKVVAYDEIYLQRSTHPRVKVHDLDGDGLLDLVVDRAWELTDLRDDATILKHDYGTFLRNVGTKTAPVWERVDASNGALHTEDYQPCDAIRQSVVRAVDWNDDGRLDVLAGDCDGFVRLFLNRAEGKVPWFAPPAKLTAGGRTLSLASHGGHARPDVCDWNNDGRRDLVIADGTGGVHLYLGEGNDPSPRLASGLPLTYTDEDGNDRPIRRGSRAHVMVCDWNRDGRKDLVFSDQENPGFWFLENVGTDEAPRLTAPRRLPPAPYVRPNLGSFVDWDGDGRRDLIACEFEHSIRLYRDVGPGTPGSAPRLDDPRGEILIRPFSIMMISGADAVDFNGDGDLDILTGQGHGGSGIRFYERDYIRDLRDGTRPIARPVRFERDDATGDSFLEPVLDYADAMLEHGRDVYGPEKSGLFLSALDRRRLRPLELRPSPPGGVRRGDRAGLPWRRLVGANPHNDQNLLRVLYALTDITGDRRYADAADHEIDWFMRHAQSPATGLLSWGEHMSWDTMLDRPIASGSDLTHEFARPWALWDRSFALAPEACRRFATGLWEHQIQDQRTGAFDRHAPFDRHGPSDGKDFPRHAGFYIDTWAHAYRHTEDATYLRAIEAVLARFERKRKGPDGAAHSTIGPLDVAAAARLVPEPLATRLNEFASMEDRLILTELRARHGQADGTLRFPADWTAGYASGASAGWAMFAEARWMQNHDDAFRDVVVAVADAYVDSLPDEDVDVWPMTFAHVISAQVAAHRLTGRPHYLSQATRFSRMAAQLYWQDSPLPRCGLKVDHYETITGADSLALALLQVHAARNRLDVTIPGNFIDR